MTFTLWKLTNVRKILYPAKIVENINFLNKGFMKDLRTSHLQVSNTEQICLLS